MLNLVLHADFQIFLRIIMKCREQFMAWDTTDWPFFLKYIPVVVLQKVVIFFFNINIIVYWEILGKYSLFSMQQKLISMLYSTVCTCKQEKLI